MRFPLSKVEDRYSSCACATKWPVPVSSVIGTSQVARGRDLSLANATSARKPAAISDRRRSRPVMHHRRRHRLSRTVASASPSRCTSGSSAAQSSLTCSWLPLLLPRSRPRSATLISSVPRQVTWPARAFTSCGATNSDNWPTAYVVEPYVPGGPLMEKKPLASGIRRVHVPAPAHLDDQAAPTKALDVLGLGLVHTVPERHPSDDHRRSAPAACACPDGASEKRERRHAELLTPSTRAATFR